MMKNRAQSSARAKHLPLHRSVPLFMSAALLLSGCSFRKRPSIPWATAIQVKPTLQAHLDGAGEADLEAPELNLETAPFATVLIPLRNAPPRPHASPSPAPTAPVADAEKPEAPTIAPQLTKQESAAAQQETSQSLNIAEKNLAATRGKTLNAAQTDLVSKIKGFLKDAREAAQAGDWARARSLAKKAQVLSEELAGSV
jgi:hypothetical protein